MEELEGEIAHADGITDHGIAAKYYSEKIRAIMDKLRACADEAEAITAKEYWPLPSYNDLLYGIS